MSSMEAENSDHGILTFYDLSSKHKGDGTISCYSLHPWKTRMVLNFKKIPFKTEWCEYPELGPKLEALGVSANQQSPLAYTSPTIRLPDGTFVMDSLSIVEKLEALYPEPSLHLEADLHGAITDCVEGVSLALMGEILILVVRNCLTEKSATWFTERYKKKRGSSIEDLAIQQGGEAAWRAAEAPGGSLENLRDVVTQHKVDAGPFTLGSKVSYGDFVAVSFFECLSRVDLKTYVRVMSFDESFPLLHQACRPWLQRDY